MVIERFKKGQIKSLYERLAQEGRMLSEGVNFVSSWIDEKIETCYQVMEANSYENLQQWMDNWSGFCEWEVIPVVTSQEAKQRVLGS